MTKLPNRWGELEIQRKLARLKGGRVNLRSELEAKQARVTAGQIVESSDVALAIYEYAEKQFSQAENTLNTSKDIPVYQSGWLQGYKKAMKDVEDHILGYMKEGDKAQEEIAKLEDKAEQEQLNKEKLREINEDFERLEKSLEESEE